MKTEYQGPRRIACGDSGWFFRYNSAMTISRSSRVLAVTAVVGLALTGGTAMAKPIPDGPGMNKAENYYGAPATPRPVTLPDVPTNPYMSANGTSNIHNDAYMTDAYSWAGPLGVTPRVKSLLLGGECASITFDSKGRIVAICLLNEAYLTLVNPKKMSVITRLKLPKPPEAAGAITANDYTKIAGSYFYLDNRDRAVVTTSTNELITYRVRTSNGKKTWNKVKEVDLSSYVTDDYPIQSALPDFMGNIWFVTHNGGVGVVRKDDGEIRQYVMDDEVIGNSFAMDEDGGVYIVSTKAMYRFDLAAGADEADGLVPTVTWREEYENAGEMKPGQKSAGSGTTPTLMSRNRVAIVDNADPENVVVYHTKPRLNGQEICSAPVFSKGASATENSLIAIGDSLIVENNYGYASLASTQAGRTTTPGIARVDVTKAGTCRNVWTNSEVIAPSVVPKFSAETGLIYTYTKPKGPGAVDRWYWTAMDYRTGKVVYSQLAGTGIAFNNNYASLYLSPSGMGFVGVTGGIVRISDRPR